MSTQNNLFDNKHCYACGSVDYDNVFNCSICLKSHRADVKPLELYKVRALTEAYKGNVYDLLSADFCRCAECDKQDDEIKALIKRQKKLYPMSFRYQYNLLVHSANLHRNMNY